MCCCTLLRSLLNKLYIILCIHNTCAFIVFMYLYAFCISGDNGSGLMNKSSTHMFEAMAMEIEQLLAQVYMLS